MRAEIPVTPIKNGKRSSVDAQIRSAKGKIKEVRLLVPSQKNQTGESTTATWGIGGWR